MLSVLYSAGWDVTLKYYVVPYLVSIQSSMSWSQNQLNSVRLVLEPLVSEA